MLVAVPPLFFGNVRLQLPAYDGALREPERQAGADELVAGKQLQLTAQAAVVALTSPLKPSQVIVEAGFVFEYRAIDAREHRVALIAAPIRPGGAHHLHGVGLDLAPVGHVRAAAKIDERVVLINGDPIARFRGQFIAVIVVLPFRHAVDQFQLVGLILKEVARLCQGHFAHVKGMPLPNKRLHAVLDGRKILFARHTGQIEIVIEAVFNGRADGHLGLRKAFEHRLRHNVGRRVPQLVQRRLIAGWNVLLGFCLQSFFIAHVQTPSAALEIAGSDSWG